MYRPTNTTTSDGWTTVSRSSPFGRRTDAPAAMPSAFGGGDPRRQQRRDEERARAEARARDERDRRAAADAEAKRKAAVCDLTSEKEYPSLGGGGATPAATKKPLAWGATVTAAAARPASVKTLTTEEKWMADYYARQEETNRRLRVAAACYDDGPEDYDGPEEDTEAWADPYAVGGGGGEHNSHLSTSGYRRGGGAW
jgi:hypothetical protein